MELILSRKAEKLARLSDIALIDTYEELVEHKKHDQVPGICCNRHCEFVVTVKPDERGALCEACSDNTVQSILVLADLV